MTGLFIRYEMVKAMSTTESLLFVVGQLFGSGEEQQGEQLETVDAMMAFAREINGG